MRKPGPNYRMSKAAKRALARILDPHLRGEVKRQIIGAELAAAEVGRTPARTGRDAAP